MSAKTKIRIQINTPAMSVEQYLLTCLAEECTELAKAATKAIRFGLDDVWQGKPTTNRADIREEYNDILALIEELNENHELNCFRHDGLIKNKKLKVAHMLLYSADRGRVKA